MLTVAAYLWFDPAWKHNDAFRYTSSDVVLLARMVRQHLSVPHRFICITDEPSLFSGTPEVEAVLLDKTKHVPGKCFCKLQTFSPSMVSVADRLLVLDLDVIVTGSLDSIVDREEELVLWRNPTRLPYDDPVVKGRPYYNTSVVLHRTGTLPAIYEQFDPTVPLPPGIRDDQWWVSALCGPDWPHWTGEDGIYRIARSDTPGSGVDGELPENARLVFFPGDRGKPWLPEVRAANPWIAQHRL